MKERSHRTLPLLVLLGIVLASAPTAIARADVEGWRLRANGFWIDGDQSIARVTASGSLVRTDADSSAGGGINGEYRFSDLVGVEVGVLGGAEIDFKLRAGFVGNSAVIFDTVEFSAACSGVNFHLTPNHRADFYAGPFVAYVNYSEARFGFAGFDPRSPFFSPGNAFVVSFEDDLALGANVGVDLPVGSGNWLFNADLRYLDTTLDATATGGSRESVGFDPLLLGVGFGYRF